MSTVYPVVAIDLDGVVCDFARRFAEIARAEGFAVPDGYVPRDWHFSDVLTRAELDRCWRAAMAVEDFWLTVSPYLDSLCLRNLFGDFQVYWLTARSQSAGAPLLWQVQTWLKRARLGGEEWGARHSTTVIVGRPNEKAAVLRAIGAKWFVDDLAETVQWCADMAPECRS